MKEPATEERTDRRPAPGGGAGVTSPEGGTSMSRVQAVGAAEEALPPPACPNCERPLTPKLICWVCCDRLCTACGQATGSAFIELCWPCSFQAAEGDAPGTSGG